jgi:uncharacterized protein
MANQLALISGASSGIGEAFARQLAEKGVDLCITGRRQEKLDTIAAELRQRYEVSVDVIVADLATEDGISQVETWIKSHPSITLLINNAGFGARGLFANKPSEKYAEMITVHITAAMRLTSAVLPAMLHAKQGAIINVSSITAFLPLAGNAVYSGTKSFLNSFTQSLSYELKNTGIKVQALVPGFTYSDFHKRPDYSKLNTYASVPKILWMTSEDVAKTSLRALGRNQLFCVPGVLNKLIAFAGKSGLAALGSTVMAQIYKNSAKKNSEKAQT